MKNLDEHWDVPNTWIFYSKDVTSGLSASNTTNKEFFFFNTNIF
jgi:hypothetical protein